MMSRWKTVYLSLKFNFDFRTRIDETEKSWIRAITKNDYKKVQQMLEERVDLLDYRDYICGVSRNCSCSV